MAPRGGALCEGITSYVETPEDITRTTSTFADAGVDGVCIPVPFTYISPLIVVVVSQIKLSMSGDEILEDLRAEDTTFSDELVATGVEAAHAKGIRVCSHARSDGAVRQCLQYGVDILYHGCTSSFFRRDNVTKRRSVHFGRVYGCS